MANATILALAFTAAAAAVFGGGGVVGWQLRAAHADQAQAADGQIVLRGVQAAEAIDHQVGGRHEIQAEAIRASGRSLQRAVSTYVPPEAVARCSVPSGAVRLLNDAAQGLPASAAPAGQPDGAASGVGIDTLAGRTAENLTTCVGIRQTLIDLQDWNTAQFQLAASYR
ncbi:hypothetical protein [Phenylobacterium sp.]|uniref:hypothetical protein n=1 Tax=Phenylobacterium sp. TaxID=1871053 RepID=UPI002F3E2BDC